MSGLLHCADADVNVTASRDPYFAVVCRLFGREDLLKDPRFASASLRGDHNDYLLAQINEVAKNRKALEVADALNAAIVVDLHESGLAAPSTITLGGRLAIRAALVNHRTSERDLDTLVEAVLRFGAKRAASG